MSLEKKPESNKQAPEKKKAADSALIEKWEREGVFVRMFPKLNEISLDEKLVADELIAEVKKRGVEKIWAIDRMLRNKDFFDGISHLRSNSERFVDYLVSTERFAQLIHLAREQAWSGDYSGLLGQEVEIRGIQTAGGRTRRIESGLKLNVGYLRGIGIDPTKVLFFRRTDPSTESPKPERYWTSDYGEVLGGLTAEVGGERRDTTVVLVSDLATIEAVGSGLIEDMNDDSGMSVCQIENKPFDQSRVLATIKDPRPYLDD